MLNFCIRTEQRRNIKILKIALYEYIITLNFENVCLAKLVLYLLLLNRLLNERFAYS